jgi:hypothetical protein
MSVRYLSLASITHLADGNHAGATVFTVGVGIVAVISVFVLARSRR